jgi:crotonobetainyl-CoA:carnitine CoA-transferase CaiB-like acyl-CoA transferase
MVENFRPGSLVRFGLDYAGAAALNPRLIYASITGFGSGGGADLPGYDLSVQAMSGLMSMTGPDDGDPYRAGVALFDVMTGMNAVIGVLAALEHRNVTGLGQLVEVNLMSTALAAMANHTTGYVASGTVPFRMGNAHPSVFPYEPLPTSDGDLIVIAGNDGQFIRLCEVLELPRLIDDERFATNNARTMFRDDLRPLLIEKLSERTRHEWFEALTAAGVPCAPINGIDEGLAFAERIGLEPVVTVEADGYSVPSIRNPIRMHASPPEYHRPPPTLGQHTDDLRAWLASPPRKDQAL